MCNIASKRTSTQLPDVFQSIKVTLLIERKLVAVSRGCGQSDRQIGG